MPDFTPAGSVQLSNVGRFVKWYTVDLKWSASERAFFALFREAETEDDPLALRARWNNRDDRGIRHTCILARIGRSGDTVKLATFQFLFPEEGHYTTLGNNIAGPNLNRQLAVTLAGTVFFFQLR